MADVIMLARRRREQILSELARIDSFLDLAAELAGDEADSPLRDGRSQSRSRQSSSGRGTVGADTVALTLEIVRERGPQATRDLVPLITAHGIPLGGKSEIATLSARLSSTGKGAVEMIGGKWHKVEQSGTPAPEAVPEREEPVDPSVAGQSTDSLFHHQTKEDRYAAALA